MKDEDTDWVVYHLIAQEPGITAEGLVDKSGLDGAIVAASLDRLDRSFLINRTGTQVRVLSVGEAMVKCQAKYDTTLPYIIEDGVIKPREKRGP